MLIFFVGWVCINCLVFSLLLMWLVFLSRRCWGFLLVGVGFIMGRISVVEYVIDCMFVGS